MPPTSEEIQEWLRQEAERYEQQDTEAVYRAALGKWETADYVVCIGAIVLLLLVVLITVATAVGA